MGKNSRPFNAFSFNNLSPIQGPSSSQSFYSIPSYWYSRKDTISGTRAWHLLIKGYKQFYQLYSNYGRKFAQSPSLVETFSIDKFQTSQGLPLFFQNNPRTCSVFLNSRTWSHGWRRNPVEMKWCQLELRRHCTAPVRSPPALVFFTCWMPFLLPANSVKALTAIVYKCTKDYWNLIATAFMLTLSFWPLSNCWSKNAKHTHNRTVQLHDTSNERTCSQCKQVQECKIRYGLAAIPTLCSVCRSYQAPNIFVQLSSL